MVWEGNNYWKEAHRHRISRRAVLRGAGALGVGLAATAMVGCGSDENRGGGTSTGTNGGSGTPRPGGTLKVAMLNDPSGLDPSTSRAGYDHDYLFSLFDNLVTYTPKFEVAPGLAHTWEVIDDLTIAFTLTTGFTYHDGTPFSSEDVRYTIERHLDPDTGSYAAGQVESIDRVEVIDDEKVVFHLKSPTASIFAILGDRAGMILPRAAVERLGDNFTFEPVGSGPMKLDSWINDSSIRMSKFTDFRTPGYPYLDGIEISVIPDSSVQFANLQTGNTDLIWISPKDVGAAKADSNIQLVQWVDTGVTLLNMNISQPPLTDMRVRQAMSAALNRQAILDAIYFGQGKIANGPITEASWAYNENLKPVEEDLRKAKQLLAAAGYPDGLSCEMVFYPREDYTPLVEMLKAQWARIGFDVTLVSRTQEVAAEEYRDQKYPMGLSFGFSGRADPDLTVYELYHSQGAFNRARYNKSYIPDKSQKDLDAKIERARAIYDQDERKALYDDIQRHIVENAHGIFFTHTLAQAAISQRVKNFTPYGDGKLRLHQLWLDA